MTVLQACVAKSGSFWLHRILRSIGEQAGFSHRSFITSHPIHAESKDRDLSFAGQGDMDFLDIEPKRCFFRVSSVFREPVKDIDSYIRECSLVWTHSPVYESSPTVLSRFDRIVYIVRDPRDVALSMSRFAFTPYFRKHYPHYDNDPDSHLANNLDNMTRYWVRHVGGYLKLKGALCIHFVFYERLVKAFDSELSKLLKYLDIDLSSTALANIRKEVSFPEMKKENPAHLHTGKSGEWVSQLSRDQQALVVGIAGPMLDLLGYAAFEVALSSSLPALHEDMSRDDVERARAASKRTAAETMQYIWGFVTRKQSLRAKWKLINKWTLALINRFYSPETLKMRS